MQKISYHIADLNISIIDIAQCMGYDNGILEEPYHSMAQEMIEKVKPHCDIQGGYLIKKQISFDPEAKTVVTSGTRFHVDNIVYHQIKHSDQLAFFACTAGKGIGALSKKMMDEGELVEGYLVDTIGTVIVETAMDKIQSTLTQEMRTKNLKTTNRYSPGYCNWNVAEQHKLFQLLPEHFCGITLTESALMDPVKSVSGIIGIGKNVPFNEYACNFCDRHDCVHRNKKFHSSI